MPENFTKETADRKIIPSPCVGLCSTTYGDTICRGCMRHTKTITGWASTSLEDKRNVIQKIDQIFETIMPDFFAIDDSGALQRALTTRLIPFDAERSPYVWLHKLLVRCVHSIEDLAQAGVSQQKTGDLFTLFQQCRKEMYLLALAKDSQC